MKTVRRAGLYLNDIIQGGGLLRSNVLEIKEILKNPFIDANDFKRSDRLEKLMSHTFNTVPFYKGLRELRFEELPVVNKNIIKSNFTSFQSQLFSGSNLHKASTSGSTGIPFIVYQNSIKRKRHFADVMYFINEADFELGNSLVELEVWRGYNKKSRLRNFLLNSVQFDVTQLNDHTIDQFLEVIASRKGKINIVGLPSAFEIIGSYMERNDLYLESAQIQGVVAISEFLNQYTKEIIEKRFDTSMYSRYSNEEMGIIAQTTSYSGQNFVLNWASYFFEILGLDSDKPVERGDLGRIVVTDLFNYAMPLIRYDTGDIGSFQEGFPDNRYLKSVDGRKMDLVYNTVGQMVSPHVVHTIFYPYLSILNQFQFVQKGKKEYSLRLNAKEPIKTETEMIQSVKREFGQDAQVTIELIDEIPALSSGKRKKVANLMKERKG